MNQIELDSSTPQTETPAGDVQKIRAVSGPAVPSVQVVDRVQLQRLPPAYEYGQETAGIFDILEANDKAQVGDTLRISYRLAVPFLQEWQSDFMVSRLNADGRFQLNHVALYPELRLLVVEVKVIKPFSPALLIAAAIVLAVAAALIWVTTISIERLSTIQVGPYKVSFTPLIVFGILGLVGLGLASHYRVRLGHDG